jgi:hypothetical protein
MSCCFGGKLLYVGNLGTLAGSLLSLFSPGTRSVAVKEARGKEEVQKAFAPRDDGEKVFEMGRAHQLRGGAVTCRETVADHGDFWIWDRDKTAIDMQLW